MPTTTLTIFISLIAGHFLADFALQTEDFVRRKREFRMLLIHALLVASVSYLLVGLPAAWPLALAVGVTHGVIDYFKTRSRQPELALFLVDQSIHFVVLGLLAWAAANRYRETISLWTGLFGPAYFEALVLATGALAAVYASGFAVEIAVKPLIQELQSEAEAQESPLAAEHRRGLLNGGRIIGYLERSLIYLFVLIGSPTAIGFLVAAKSVFRFGELSDRSNRVEAEYIIIGTLMSFLLGLLCAYAARALLAALAA